MLDVAQAAFAPTYPRSRPTPPDSEVALIRSIWASAAYVPDLDLVAVVDDTIVGHVAHTIATVGDHAVVSLDVLSVEPESQGRGIGSGLVTDALRRADDLGHPMVVLLGHPDYYPRFGFEPATTLGLTYEDKAAPFPAFQARRLRVYDAAIRGEVRLAVESP